MLTRFREAAAPLRRRELQLLFGAQTISGIGDWLGRLALSAAVFDRAGGVWAVLITVVTLVPWLGPGQLLATFADKFGRVAVMVAADVVRAAAFAALMVELPLPVTFTFAGIAGLCIPPFAGARSAALVELSGDDYPKALNLFAIVNQTEVLIGYALGGVIVAAAGTRAALGVNAVTFAISALLLAGLRASSAATRDTGAATGRAGLLAGLRVWRSDRMCWLSLLAFAGTSGLAVLPEALVVPAAAQVGLGRHYVGVAAALIAVGCLAAITVGFGGDGHASILRRAALRCAALGLAAGAGFAAGGPAGLLAAMCVSGAVDAIAVPTNRIVGARLPARGRAAAMAVAGGAQYTSQSVCVIAAAAAVHGLEPTWVLAAAMLLAAVWLCGIAAVVGDDAADEPTR